MAVLMFGKAELDAQIARIAPQIPAGDDNALIGSVDEQGIQAVILLKREINGGTLKAAGILRHTWAGDNQAGGALIFSWPSQ